MKYVCRAFACADIEKPMGGKRTGRKQPFFISSVYIEQKKKYIVPLSKLRPPPRRESRRAEKGRAGAACATCYKLRVLSLSPG